jgi:hypothetical protein
MTTYTFQPSLSNEFLKVKSELFDNCMHHYKFITIDNIYKLSNVAKEYSTYSLHYSSLKNSLVKEIMNEHPIIIRKLPSTFIDSIREFVDFFKNADGFLELKDPLHFSFDTFFSYKIVCKKLMTDNIYKIFIPFTKMYKLKKSEKEIEQMFQEIANFVFGVNIHINIIYPLCKYDEEDELIQLTKKIVGL